MRFFLDVGDFIEDLRHLYRSDEYAICLAKILRAEELHREKSNQAARKVGAFA
jgi:hypothetical protein